MKKQRGDAKLKTLPATLQAQIFEHCKLTDYLKVKAWLEKEHGIHTSAGSLSEFFRWYPLSRRLDQAAQFAEDLKAQLAAVPSLQLDADRLQQVAAVAFEARAVQEQDADLYLALRKRRQKDTELTLKQQNQELRLKQYEEKITAMRAGLEKAKSKGGLSAETRDLIEQQLKLL